VGHSFGGVIILLTAERDTSIRAEVTFGAGANSWQRSPELREQLLAMVRKTSAPIMHINTANDYDTTPSSALGAELDRRLRQRLTLSKMRCGRSLDGETLPPSRCPADIG
jgi:hypothetical protein